MYGLIDDIQDYLKEIAALKAENERLRQELAEARQQLAISDEMANSHTNIVKASD